jgi:hypothetical protein
MCLFVTNLMAQTNGTIIGYSQDPSGAAVPNLKITVTNERTGATRSTQSDQNGFYQVLGLISGVYTVEAEASGFKQYRSTGVTLQVDQNLRLDISLQVGQVTDSVEVTANAALVDTRSSQTSATIDDRRVVDLPLSGRNVFRLASTLPGVLSVNTADNSDITGLGSGPTMNVNGGRANMNYNRLNGTYLNDPGRNTGLNAPPPDAVQEFKIQTSNYAADTGRNSGGNITIVSKQGTNQFHGALWEFHRNDNLNARSFFQTSKPQLIQNQYGAAAGAPIVRNKAFLFGTFENIADRRQAATTNAFPPTAAEVQGDFSRLNGTKQLRNPFDNTPFPGNQIPTSLFDPATRKLLQFLPVVPAGSVQAVGPNPRNSRLFMFRHDLNLSSKHALFAHYYFNQNEQTAEGLAFGSNIADWTGQSNLVRIQNAGINHTYTISPNLLNQLTLGYTRGYSFSTPTVTRLPSELGISGLPVYTDGGSPQFTVSGRFSLLSGGPIKAARNSYGVQDHFTMIHGVHTLKVGFEFLDIGNFAAFLGPPQFSFNGQRTGGGVSTSGDPMADFLLGGYQSLAVTNGVRNQDGRYTFTTFFVQDDLKVSRRLTLNLGLRWELPTPWVHRYDLINTVVPDPTVRSKKYPSAPPGMLFPGDLPRGLYNKDLNNFAPRVGFAWDVFGDGRTAIRAAYGVFYDTFNTDTIAQENPPFVGGRQTFVNGLMSNPFASIGAVAPPAFIDPNAFSFTYPINGYWSGTGRDSLRTTYIHEWNFTISRQLWHDYALSVGYIGKTGIKILAFRPFNAAIYIPGVDAQGRPLSTEANAGSRAPFLPGIYGTESIYLDNSFTSTYESMQIVLDKRFSKGFQLSTSYTLAKSIDSSSTTTLGACLSNPFDARADRGRSDWDRRHAFVLSGVWSPPIYAAHRGFLGRVAGGWTLSGISTVQSGAPVTAFTGQNTALDGNICGGSSLHPDIIGIAETDHSSRADMVSNYFNRNAFVLPAVGRYGTAGRGIFSGPALVSNNMAVLKDIAVRESLRFQFRAEFANLFNQVNFSNPVATLSSATYGRITGAQPGRTIQLGLKFLW